MLVCDCSKTSMVIGLPITWRNTNVYDQIHGLIVNVYSSALVLLYSITITE